MPFRSVMNAIKSFTSPEMNVDGGLSRELTHSPSLRTVQEREQLLRMKEAMYRVQYEQAQHEEAKQAAMMAQMGKPQQDMTATALAQLGANRMSNTITDQQIEALAKSYEKEITKKLVEAGIFPQGDDDGVTLDESELELTDEAKQRLELKIAALKKMWADEDEGAK